MIFLCDLFRLARKFQRNLLVTLSLAVLTGCGGGEISSSPSAPARAVQVDWLGHECFQFTSSLGTKMLVNPYSPGAGPRSLPSPLKPDVILVTHEKQDANYVDAAENSPVVFRGAVGIGTNNAAGLRIRGVPTYSQAGQPSVASMNVAYVWTLDGVRFCFLGEPEHVFSASELADIGPVDVVFLPVGRPAGLSAEEREALIAQLRPRVIVPMGRAADMAAWGAAQSRPHQLPGSSVLLSRALLPFESTTLIFAP